MCLPFAIRITWFAESATILVGLFENFNGVPTQLHMFSRRTDRVDYQNSCSNVELYFFVKFQQKIELIKMKVTS